MHRLWSEARKTHTKGAFHFNCYSEDFRDKARVVAVRQHLKCLQRSVIYSHFAPQIMQCFGMFAGEYNELLESFLYESLIGGNEEYDRDFYDILDTKTVTYVTAFGTAKVTVAIKVRLKAQFLALEDVADVLDLGPADYGAFPSQPPNPKLALDYAMLWVDRCLLDAYSDLRYGEAFVSAHKLLPVLGKLSRLKLSEHVFPHIVREYRASLRPMETNPMREVGVEENEECVEDPFRDCPICALVPEKVGVEPHVVQLEFVPHVVPGELESITEKFRGSEFGVAGLCRAVHSFSADAVTKAVRLKSKKDDAKEEEMLTHPSVYMNMDYINKEISAFKAANAAAKEEAAVAAAGLRQNSALPVENGVSQPIAPTTPDGEASDADDDDVQESFTCAQQIRASREPDSSLKGSAKLSEQCLAAAVCHHGFVLRGSARSSQVPENFKLYHDMLNDMLPHRFPLHVCIDNACQCGPSWETRHPDLATRHPFLEYRTPMWHGAAHDERCRFTKSMTFKKGAGRRHGENTEHLWAYLRPCWSTGKYMTYGNHKFLYEEGLMSWNVKKRKALSRQVTDWLRTTLPAKHASLMEERKEILKKAKEGHNQDEPQMLDHATRILAKAIGEVSDEDDDLEEFEKPLMKIIEDEEFVCYFKGKKTPRQTFTPLGKFSKDSEEEVEKAEDRIKEARAQAARANSIAHGTVQQLEGRLDKLRRKFVISKIKWARAQVEDLFQVRHQLKADFERAVKVGPGLGRRRDKSAVKGQLTTNTKKIDIHVFQYVSYWEDRYCQIYKTSFVPYEYDYVAYTRENVEGWKDFDLQTFGYPLWTDLRVDMTNKESELISTADGCGSARVKYFALRLLVLDEDIDRTLEEVDLLGVELKCLKVYASRISAAQRARGS